MRLSKVEVGTIVVTDFGLYRVGFRDEYRTRLDPVFPSGKPDVRRTPFSPTEDLKCEVLEEGR